MRMFPVLLSLSACSDATRGNSTDAKDDALALVEGTPDAVGVLRYVNDVQTTLAELDSFLHSDTARNIEAGRVGADGVFGTADDTIYPSVAELDRIAQVGPRSMEAIWLRAGERGYIPQGDEFLGTFDGVDFSVNDATRVLGHANGMAFEDLDAFLYSDTATNIVAGRPYASMLELAAVPQLGPASMTYLKAHKLAVNGLVDELALWSDGLTVISESDYPWDVVFIAGGAPEGGITVDNVKDVVAPHWTPDDEDSAPLASRSVEQYDETVAEYFANAAAYYGSADYSGEEDPALRDQWTKLGEVMSRISDAELYYIGHKHSEYYDLIGPDVDLYIVGTTPEGDVVGLHTILIWT